MRLVWPVEGLPRREHHSLTWQPRAHRYELIEAVEGDNEGVGGRGVAYVHRKTSEGTSTLEALREQAESLRRRLVEAEAEAARGEARLQELEAVRSRVPRPPRAAARLLPAPAPHPPTHNFLPSPRSPKRPRRLPPQRDARRACGACARQVLLASALEAMGLRAERDELRDELDLLSTWDDAEMAEYMATAEAAASDAHGHEDAGRGGTQG